MMTREVREPTSGQQQVWWRCDLIDRRPLAVARGLRLAKGTFVCLAPAPRKQEGQHHFRSSHIATKLSSFKCRPCAWSKGGLHACTDIASAACFLLSSGGHRLPLPRFCYANSALRKGNPLVRAPRHRQRATSGRCINKWRHCEQVNQIGAIQWHCERRAFPRMILIRCNAIARCLCFGCVTAEAAAAATTKTKTKTTIGIETRILISRHLIRVEISPSLSSFNLVTWHTTRNLTNFLFRATPRLAARLGARLAKRGKGRA